MKPEISLLQLVPEPLPTHRPDVTALFGRYLPRLGIHCHIVGKSASGEEKTGNQFASQQRSSPAGSRLRREWSYIVLCWRHLIAARQSGVDVIQVRDMVSMGLLAMLVARLYRLPFVYWMSYPMSEDRIMRARKMMKKGSRLRALALMLKGTVEKALLYRVVLPLSNHVFVQSDAMQSMVCGFGIPASKLTPVPMGADTEILLPDSVAPRRPTGWGGGNPVFAYLGTLDMQRDIATIIDALALLRQRYPAARLLLIGDASNPADTAVLRDKIDSLGEPDLVRITGWLPPYEAWNLLAGADAAISYCPRSPVLDVGSPTKLLEYLALGMPAIANDNPDQVHVMQTSQAGWLCDSTAQGLANAMEAVLADPGEAARRAACGPAFIRQSRSYRVLAAPVAAEYLSLRGLHLRQQFLAKADPP